MAQPWEKYQAPEAPAETPASAAPWSKYSQTKEKPKAPETPFGEKAIEFVRPTVEALGTVGGGILGGGGGTVLGPVGTALGTVGGAGAGYATAKKGLDVLEESLGYKKSPTAREAIKQSLADVATGAEYETGGQILGQGAKAALKAAPKAVEAGRSAVEFINKVRGKPLEEALGTLKTSTEDLTKKAISKVAETEKVGQQKIYSDQARQETNLRDAAKRFTQEAQTAKAESQASLNKIAPVTNEQQVGTGLRQLVTGVKGTLENVKTKIAEPLKNKYFNEGKAKEKAGQFWAQSKTGQEFMKFLNDMTNPINAGKYTEYEVAAARDLRNSLVSRKVKGQPVRSEIEKIEKVIRETKKLPSMPSATGADALKQQAMGKLAQRLEDSVYGYVDEAGAEVEGFAPSGRTFRNVYADMMKPLNAYESPVGKALTQEVERLKGIYTTDATQLPNMVFRSPEQIQVLDQMGVGKKSLEPFAAQHTANELSKLNTADGIKAWLDSAKASYLNEFPALAKQAKEYARVFEQNEAKALQKTQGATALEKGAKDAIAKGIESRQSLEKMTTSNKEYIEKYSFALRNATTKEQFISNSESYIKGLKERNIVSSEEAEQLLAKVKVVKDSQADQAAAKKAISGLLPWITGGSVLGVGAMTGYGLNKLLGIY